MGWLLAKLRFALDHRWTPPRASEYLDGELSEGDRRRVARHLGDCPECRALLRELGAVIRSLGGLKEEVDTPVAAGIVRALRGRLDEPPRDNT